MLIVLHIVSALLSLGWAILNLVLPSRTKLRITYLLSVLTVGSGTCLVLYRHVALMSACTSGLVYLTVILGLTAFARETI